METGDLRPITEWNHDAQWADEFHHLLHVLLTGEREGYYADYPSSILELSRQYQRTPPQTARVLLAEPRPGRKPRARRPSETGGAGVAGGRAPLGATDAAAVHGRGVRRDAALPVLHRPRRSRDRRGNPRAVARRSSSVSPRSPERTSLTRRTDEPSIAPSWRRRPAIQSSERFTRDCSRSVDSSRRTFQRRPTRHTGPSASDVETLSCCSTSPTMSTTAWLR